jgi:HK97 gp10 family phage protein
MDALRALPPELVGKRGGPILKALRKAAVPLLDDAKRNVRRIIDTPNAGGDDRSTGLLLLSLQIARAKLDRGVNGEAVRVGIKRGQFYPANRQAKKEKTSAAQVGRQLEYGTEKRSPMPWLRPAFDSKKEAAVQVFVAEAKRAIEAAKKKMDRIAAAKARMP